MAGPRATAILLALATSALAPAAPAAAAAPARGSTQLRHALLSSRELWATIDVCHPADQPHTVGIRGSMPGDGHSGDRMYMSFRLQYQDSKSKGWLDLAGASSKFLAVGGGGSPLQGGRSFELKPGRSSFMLRGVVEFQWRRGASVVQSTWRPTGAGHRSVAGADPSGYSAATCSLG